MIFLLVGYSSFVPYGFFIVLGIFEDKYRPLPIPLGHDSHSCLINRLTASNGYSCDFLRYIQFQHYLERLNNSTVKYT